MGALDNLYGLRRLRLAGAKPINAAGQEIFSQTFNLLGGWTLAEGVDAEGEPTVDLTPPAGGAGSGTGSAPRARILVPTTDTANAHTGLAALDGVTPIAGDTILDTSHATPALRGYWQAGTPWTRPTFYDSDAEVAALFGSFTFVEEGTAGGGRTYQHTIGETLLGAKSYNRVLNAPDVVYGLMGLIAELGFEEGTGTTRARVGTRVNRDKAAVASAIPATTTQTIWTWDAGSLGFLAGDVEFLCPTVLVKWASDSKYQVCARGLLAAHGAPPTLVGKRPQVGEEGSGGTLDYLALDWALSGNNIILTAWNKRASARTVRVLSNYAAFE